MCVGLKFQRNNFYLFITPTFRLYRKFNLRITTRRRAAKYTTKMSEFKRYRRTQIAEMRPVTDYDIDIYNKHACELIVMNGKEVVKVSISVEDLANGSPKIGDMIARNPKNHNDQWLVAQQYFSDNFELIQ